MAKSKTELLCERGYLRHDAVVDEIYQRLRTSEVFDELKGNCNTVEKEVRLNECQPDVLVSTPEKDVSFEVKSYKDKLLKRWMGQRQTYKSEGLSVAWVFRNTNSVSGVRSNPFPEKIKKCINFDEDAVYLLNPSKSRFRLYHDSKSIKGIPNEF